MTDLLTLLKVAAVAFGLLPTARTADPTNAEAAALAFEVGLTPHRLAAAGFNAPQVSAILAGIRNGAAAPTLVVARGAVEQVQVQFAGARRQWQADPTNLVLRTQVRELRQQLATTRQSLAAARAALAVSVLEGMPPENLQRLAALRGAGLRHAPDELGVVAWTPLQWRRLEEATVLEVRSLRQGVSVPPEAASLLAQARANSAVVEAAARVSSNLAAISEVFAAP